MVFLTLSQNQSPCNFHFLSNTEQAWTSFLHNSLVQIRNSRRDVMFLLIFLLLGLQVPSAPMGPNFLLLFYRSYNLVYKVLWTLSHILLKVKSNVHSIWWASLTAHSIQKRKGDNLTRSRSSCWLWHVTDSLANCSKSFHLTTYSKTDPRSMSISIRRGLWCCLLLIRTMFFLFLSSQVLLVHKDQWEWFYDLAL